MRRLTTIFATMILCMGVTAPFTSCSDEKGDEPTTPAAKSVAGTYTGDLTCSVMGEASVFEAKTFTVEAVDDATVNVTIPSFGNPPMQLPEIQVEGVAVSGTNGTYKLAETAIDVTTESGKKCTGTLGGEFADNTLRINFTLQYGNMPMPMVCSFSAPKE